MAKKKAVNPIMRNSMLKVAATKPQTIPKEILKTNFDLSPKMIIKSGWNKGFWCVRKLGDCRMFPILFKDFNEIKDWKIEIND